MNMPISGIYFSKRCNYNKIVILAYKFDFKLKQLLAAQLLIIKLYPDETELLYQFKCRHDVVSRGFDRLKSACPLYCLEDL